MPETVHNRREAFRDAFRMQDRIAALLRDAPQTIPSLASVLGASTVEVMPWLMAMWRYGLVTPTGKADAEGYYRYKLSA
jgi:hypothetical protein